MQRPGEHAGRGSQTRRRCPSWRGERRTDRGDARYIDVRCNAQDPFGNGYTTDYDEQGSGALVGVHFTCSFVYGIYRKITAACTHHAD